MEEKSQFSPICLLMSI